MQTSIGIHRSEAPAAEKKANPPKWQRSILLFVLAYEGAGALLGGSLLITAPDGRLMKMPVEIMHGSFTNFLIPGVILFVLGILTTLAFFFGVAEAGQFLGFSCHSPGWFSDLVLGRDCHLISTSLASCCVGTTCCIGDNYPSPADSCSLSS